MYLSQPTLTWRPKPLGNGMEDLKFLLFIKVPSVWSKPHLYKGIIYKFQLQSHWSKRLWEILTKQSTQNPRLLLLFLLNISVTSNSTIISVTHLLSSLSKESNLVCTHFISSHNIQIIIKIKITCHKSLGNQSNFWEAYNSPSPWKTHWLESNLLA